MNIFRQLTEKSWEPSQGPAMALPSGQSFRLPPSALGLRVFFGVMTVIFFLLIVAYAERMTYEDWRPTPQQWLLWWNTAALIISSVAFQFASFAIRRDRVEDAKAGLIAAGLFAVFFIAGQLLAWQQLKGLVYFDLTNPAIAFFYLITIAHALHMVGGLVAWIRTMEKVWRGYSVEKVRQSVELCTTYWHFLLVIWLVLFGLLFSGNTQLEFLLKICGLK